MRLIDKDKLLELCKTKLLIDSKKDTKQFIEDLETLLDLWKDIYVEAIPISYIENLIEELKKEQEYEDEILEEVESSLIYDEIVILEDLIWNWRKENEHSNNL